MTRIGRVLGAAFALSLAAAGSASAGETIRLRADAYCPINCDPGSDLPGTMIEIAKAIFEPQGISIDYKLLPWSRTLSDVREGAIDGAVGANAEDARDFIYPKTALARSQNMVVSLKTRGLKIATAADFKGHLLGVVRDYSYETKLDEYIKDRSADATAIKVFSGDDVQKQMVRVLQAGRIDAFVEDESIMTYTLSKLDKVDDVTMSPYGDPVDAFIAFSPKAPNAKKWADMMDEGMKGLRSSGRLKAILARYGLKDWAPTS